MPSATPPRLTRHDLVDAYAHYGRPREHWLIGAESERHLLHRASGRPATYEGAHGVRSLLQDFVAEGWRPDREAAALIGGTHQRAAITLEPGAQFELSGAPMRTVGAIVDEATAFSQDVDRHLQQGPYRQCALGYTPFIDVDAIGWVPKGRYAIMRDHMKSVGSLGHHMMKGTAATQASFDFSDEEDCARKVRVASASAPIVTAMFANSPYRLGKPSGFKSFRAHTWTDTDASRTGFPPAALAYSHSAWVDYLLDVPMMFTKVGGRWAPADGRTFRQWMEQGDAQGVFPTWSDWDLHLTSVFPEVRVKRQIEVRMADCVSIPLMGAFCALFEGLFYCSVSTQDALGILDRFTQFGTPQQRFDIASRHALSGVVGGRPLAWWAEQLVEAARSGLSRCAPAEVRWLDPLIARVARGRCPADDLLDKVGPTPSPQALLDATHPLCE